MLLTKYSEEDSGCLHDQSTVPRLYRFRMCLQRACSAELRLRVGHCVKAIPAAQKPALSRKQAVASLQMLIGRGGRRRPPEGDQACVSEQTSPHVIGPEPSIHRLFPSHSTEMCAAFKAWTPQAPEVYDPSHVEAPGGWISNHPVSRHSIATMLCVSTPEASNTRSCKDRRAVKPTQFRRPMHGR